MIAENVRVSKSGDVTGDINYLSGMSSYPVGQQSGHYFPTQIASKLYDTKLHVGGKPNDAGFAAGKEFTPTASDPYLVIRVENCTDENKVTVYEQETKDKLFTLNFGAATLAPPVGKDAVKGLAEKTDFGGYGKTTDFWDTVPMVTWDGKTAKVVGTLKKADATEKRSEGYWFPVVMADWFSGKDVSVFCKNEGEAKQETDWIIKLEDNTTPITVKYNGEVIATLDLSGLTVPAAAAYAAASTKRAVRKKTATE